MATSERSAGLLEDRVAVVTGGGALGSAVAAEFLRHGALVEVWDRSAAVTERLVSELPQLAAARQVDVTRPGAPETAATAAVAAHGRVDVLVNSAAVATFSAVSDLSRAMWEETIEIDLTGVFLCCRAFLRHMMDRRSGAIVNFSSIGGMRGEPEFSHYSAAKFGVIGLTQSLAAEVGPFGVRANCVCPGAVVSEMNTATLERHAQRTGVGPEEMTRRVVERTPLRRLGEPTDVAKAVVFLASDLASFVTGEALCVTGGIR